MTVERQSNLPAEAIALAQEWSPKAPPPEVAAQIWGLIERSQKGPELLNCEPFESLRQLAARPSLRLRALCRRLGIPDPAQKKDRPAGTGRR